MRETAFSQYIFILVITTSELYPKSLMEMLIMKSLHRCRIASVKKDMGIYSEFFGVNPDSGTLMKIILFRQLQ